MHGLIMSPYHIRCCGIDDLSVMEVHRENLSVILVDNGIVDDHLPNHVLSTLKDCKAKFMNTEQTNDSEGIQESRERTEHLIRNVRKAVSEEGRRCMEGSRNPFKFMAESPMQEPAGGSSSLGGSRAARHSQLRKQTSFDEESSLHPPVSSEHATELTRISECVDEDSLSTQIELGDMTDINQVLVQVDINETAFVDEETEELVDYGTDPNPDGMAGPESETAFQYQDTTTSNSHARSLSQHDSEIFGTPHGATSRSSSVELKAGLKLRLGVADSGSTDSISSNKLLARRNISNDNLKLKISTNSDTVTPL